MYPWGIEIDQWPEWGKSTHFMQNILFQNYPFQNSNRTFERPDQ